MDNKYLLLIGVVVVILCAAGAFLYFNNNSNNASEGNVFNVGSASFELPEGYKVTDTKNNTVKISNGVNSVNVVYYNDKNIKKHINQYVSMKEKDGYQVNISNYTVSNHTVYKSELGNDTNTVHYWFKDQNTTYSIYSQDANKNIDKFVNSLIKSMETKNN